MNMTLVKETTAEDASCFASHFNRINSTSFIGIEAQAAQIQQSCETVKLAQISF